MFKKFPNLTLGLLFVALLGLAAVQGRRVDHTRDCERFYRWIISACTQVRIFGLPGTVSEEDPNTDAVDIRLFNRLVGEADNALPDIPPSDTDYDAKGNQFPKVVRYTVAPPDPETEISKEESSALETEEQIKRDWQLWNFASSDEIAPLRHEFLLALRDGKLTSSGSQFNLSGLYEEHGTTISLANMFLGFRKMAANLVWLEVDKLWHKGSVYQMIPLMKTCVTLDPTFVDAFLVGAWHLSYNATAKLPDTPYELRTYYPEYNDWLGEKEKLYYSGIEFLKDGIRKNPRNYKLFFDLGFGIEDVKLHNTPEAIKYLSYAIQLHHDRWVPRQLYRLMGEDGQYVKSKAGWEKYLQTFPENQVAPRFVKLMDGAIKERDADWASYRARAAEELADRAKQQGQAARAQQWEEKAQAALEAETKGYAEARKYWQTVLDDSNGEDVYAQSRVLLLNGREHLQKKRYIEAIVDFDRARWASAQFWDEGTKLMVDTKIKANEPLSLTERRQLEREKKSQDYTRHLPKSIAGRHFEFDDGTWYQTDTGGSRPAEMDPVKKDSDAMLELEYEHPDIAKPLDELDGNIALLVGDKWYEVVSDQPALASKLYTPPTG